MLLTYNPDGYSGFKYSKIHAAYTNNLSKFDNIPAPTPPSPLDDVATPGQSPNEQETGSDLMNLNKVCLHLKTKH